MLPLLKGRIACCDVILVLAHVVILYLGIHLCWLMPCKVLAIVCSRGLLLALLLGAQRYRLASSEVILTVRVQAGEGEGWWYLVG